MLKTITTILFVGLSLAAYSQDLDKEIGFKYVKAEYLVGTERMEDAIKELNDIIKSNPLYKDALMLRAKTRYKLGAFKGSKEDIMKSIESLGITLDAATLLGKAEVALGNQDAALNSLSAAIDMGSKDEKVYELRAQIYESKDMLLSACEDWYSAADLGSTNAAISAKNKCGERKPERGTILKPKRSDSDPINLPDDGPSEVEVEDQPTKSNNDTESGDNSGGVIEDDTSQPPTDNTTPGEIEDDMNLPPEDNTANKITIDEDLTLSIFGQGLGKREILDRPSILILSDESGVVAVEICVNENGKVDYAEFAPDRSTLKKNSLVSLAIRKSKEFWFEKSDYSKQCGFILFNIKGSN